jgi:hypothetical protein
LARELLTQQFHCHEVARELLISNLVATEVARRRRGPQAIETKGLSSSFGQRSLLSFVCKLLIYKGLRSGTRIARHSGLPDKTADNLAISLPNSNGCKALIAKDLRGRGPVGREYSTPLVGAAVNR